MSDRNPYETPNSRVDDAPSPIDRRFRWKAVLIGAATDLVGTFVSGFVLLIVFTTVLGPDNARSEQLLQSWPFLMFSMILGGACTFAGGYVAARMAAHSFLKHALAAGALSFVAGILLFGSDDSNSPYSGLLSALGYGLHFPLAFIGGWIAWKHAAQANRTTVQQSR